MPKISVCIPTFNRSHFLPFAIDSVFAQTFEDWELIVCDDGSIDETPELMTQYSDPRVRYIRHAHHVGKSNNMRSGFQAAIGEYFIKFDDDDRLTSEFLKKTSDVLDCLPRVDFVSTDHWMINSNNQQLEEETKANSKKWGRTELSEGVPDNLLDVIFVRQSFQIGATLFRQQALLDVDYMRPNLQNCEDNDLLVRLALAGKSGYYLPERLMEYRIHPEQQGIDRAIPYLQDKIHYLENFMFESAKLEAVRRSRLAQTQLILGLRLVEKGQTQSGRELIRASDSNSKAYAGFAMSFLPPFIRQPVFNFVRRIRGRN
jgi:glycosyltransferase involved in cell wall biosynthesis